MSPFTVLIPSILKWWWAMCELRSRRLITGRHDPSALGTKKIGLRNSSGEFSTWLIACFCNNLCISDVSAADFSWSKVMGVGGWCWFGADVSSKLYPLTVFKIQGSSVIACQFGRKCCSLAPTGRWASCVTTSISRDMPRFGSRV